MKRIGMTLAALVAMILTTAAQSCPDNNHPHAIDLGLKVKWACCNLPATRGLSLWVAPLRARALSMPS